MAISSSPNVSVATNTCISSPTTALTASNPPVEVILADHGLEGAGSLVAGETRNRPFPRFSGIVNSQGSIRDNLIDEFHKFAEVGRVVPVKSISVGKDVVEQNEYLSRRICVGIAR